MHVCVCEVSEVYSMYAHTPQNAHGNWETHTHIRVCTSQLPVHTTRWAHDHKPLHANICKNSTYSRIRSMNMAFLYIHIYVPNISEQRQSCMFVYVRWSTHTCVYVRWKYTHKQTCTCIHVSNSKPHVHTTRSVSMSPWLQSIAHYNMQEFSPWPFSSHLRPCHPIKKPKAITVYGP